MSRTEAVRESLHDVADRAPFLDSPTAVAVAAIALLGLLARLLVLGDRIAHFDEARVGYWILQYAETGSFAYRGIIHGPFLHHVNRVVFALLGANDFTARLPVALVGGLLPLSALLFREHLRRSEVVVLSGFLAFNPILLYYSRFMRGDVLVGAFMFVALGCLVRLYDTRSPRYLYGIAAFIALGFAAKENALLYLATWVGAAALLADQALFRPRRRPSGLSLLLGKAGWLRDRLSAAIGRPLAFLRGYPLHVLGAAVVFFGLSLFFYAPRGRGLPGLYFPGSSAGDWVGLWEAVLDPSRFPALVDRTIDHTVSEYAYWLGQGGTPPRLDLAASRELTGSASFVEQLTATQRLGDVVAKAVDLAVSAYLLTLQGFVAILGVKAAPLAAFGLLGILYERYAAENSRNLVIFSTYAAVASLLGYALGADIFAPWLLVHVVLPLSIPAAVGLVRVGRWSASELEGGDRIGVAIVALLVLLLGATAVASTASVYVDDQAGSNVLVQYAQPSDDMRYTLADLERVSAEHARGADAVVYSGASWSAPLPRSVLVRSNVTAWKAQLRRPGGGLPLAKRPACVKWTNALPLPWYFELFETTVDCSRNPGNLTDRIAGDSPPPVVITPYEDATVPREALRESYVPRTYRLRAMQFEQPLTEEAPQERRVIVWVHRDWTRE